MEALLARVALGDQAAFERLSQGAAPRLFAICLRVLQDRQGAAEALEDALVKIWRYAERFPAAGVRPMVFIAAITRNLAIERLRARGAPGKALEAASSLSAARQKPDDRALRRVGGGAPLASALETMGADDARRVRLAYFGAAPYAALAAREGVAVPATRARMRQILPLLAGAAGTTDRDDRIDALEYVLSLHDPATRRTFELALLDDAALAAEVWRAESALAPLAEALTPRKPPARVWRGVQRKALATAARAAGRRAPRRALAFWRSLATLLGVAAIAAGCLVAVLVLRPEAVLSPAPADSVAALVSQDGAVTLARLRGDGTLLAEPFGAALADGRTPQLWVVAEGGVPQPVGVLSAAKQTVLAAPEPAEALKGARLEITEEPQGGSPSGKPTGAVLAQGTLRQI
ncbi:MAG: hypothetical protein AcusKO_46110 [Acuticoccus sp.]